MFSYNKLLLQHNYSKPIFVLSEFDVHRIAENRNLMSIYQLFFHHHFKESIKSLFYYRYLFTIILNLSVEANLLISSQIK